MATALNAINAAINQYTPNYYVDPTASAGVQGIQQQSGSSLQDTLNQLKQKINDSMAGFGQQTTSTTNQYDANANTLNQNLQAVPAQYQPDYNSHAQAAALALRNVIEGAANRGDNGGMAQENQLMVNSAQQGADAATDTSKNNAIQGINTLISNNSTSKAAALQAIQDAITQLNSDTETTLGSDIASNDQNRLSSVATEQGAEATAAQKAAQADAANQVKLLVAQIGANASMSNAATSAAKSGTSVKAPAVSTNPQINTAITQFQANGQLKTNNPLPLMQSISSQYANDPAAANAILGGISYNQVLLDKNGNAYTTSSLADYANALNNGYTSHTMYQANANGTVTAHDSAYSTAGYKASVANGWYTTQAAAQAAANKVKTTTKVNTAAAYKAIANS